MSVVEFAHEFGADCYSGKVVKIETGERLRAALPFCFGGREMERKRVAGRFVREGLDGAAPGAKRSEVAAPRPKACRTYTRARVAEALPEILTTFVEEAKKGSIRCGRWRWSFRWCMGIRTGCRLKGVLTLVDVASDKAPSGARGHRVVLTRAAAETALPSLLGMAVDYKAGWDGHDARQKCGIITAAELDGRQG
jgi:hypothetical protein